MVSCRNRRHHSVPIHRWNLAETRHFMQALPAIADNSVGSSNRTLRIQTKSYHPRNPPDEWFLAALRWGPSDSVLFGIPVGSTRLVR